MKILSTVPFFTIDFVINLGSNVVLILVFQTIAKLISKLP